MFRKTFVGLLPIGAIWAGGPGAVMTLSFVSRCPRYQLTKAAANMLIQNLF